MTIELLHFILGTFMMLGSVKFDYQQANTPPQGWTIGKLHFQSELDKNQQKLSNGEWKVVKDTDAPSSPMVLKQTGSSTFSVCIKNGTSLKDGYVEVKFKPISGKNDQSGGIVWRYIDAKNYYVVRANALENNVVLYKMEKGKRTSLEILGRKGGYGVEHIINQNQWQSLRIEFVGDTFAVALNGNEIFRVKDNTFSKAGKIGLWTKADSVTLFDNFTFGKYILGH